MGIGDWTDRYICRADLQVAGIVVQHPLEDLGVDQYPVEERRGHGCRLGRMEDFFKTSGYPHGRWCFGAVIAIRRSR
jgi:hypothetical protein